MIYFTSDTHFGDARRIRIDHRPFASIAEHDAALVQRWNEVVGDDDDIYHLGDVTAFADAARVGALIASLKGRKHLIIGNNDGPATLADQGWASVQPYIELMLEERRVILCHYAFRTWRDMSKGSIDLHGHSHGRLKEGLRQYDVGVDVFDYRPVTFATILERRRTKAKPEPV